MSKYFSKKKEFDIHGVKFHAYDVESSQTLDYLERELRDDVMDLSSLELPEAPVIVDIGANVGIVSFYLATKYPLSKIYSYEPHHVNFRNLKGGIKSNGLWNIEAYELGVWSKGTTEMDIMLCPENSGGSSHWLSSGVPSRVRLCTLSQIVHSHSLERIDFLKIDCEGAEWEIFKDFELPCPVGRLFIEIHLWGTNKTQKDLEIFQEGLKSMKGLDEIRTLTWGLDG
jgi:FkbM family methyltransferase